jgi:hypothetical protein
MDFIVNCFCDCPGSAPSGGQGQIIVTGGDLAAWRAIAANVTEILCGACGCTQRLADGVTQIDALDTAAPRIDSIDVATGTSAGGTVVVVTGHRLDTPGLVVKFDGVLATGLRDQSDANCTVDTPAHAAGTVDVTVENDNGQRLSGGALTGGFVYT